MTSEHTPGPWDAEIAYSGPEVLPLDNKRVRVVMSSNFDCDVAYLSNLRPESEQGANAHLIAAAPDLLAACKDAVDTIRDGNSPDKDYRLPGWEEHLLVLFETAIAKAEEIDVKEG